MSERPIDWPPLGLPRGSVRALLTMLIVSIVIVQVVRGQELELLWIETLMMALAHYFEHNHPFVLRLVVPERIR